MLSNYELVFRVVIAGACGILIGYERTNRNKEAGLRTHAIVALSAALMMIISKYGFEDIGKFDGSRVASQIVSGVGFLGAGIIFVKNRTVISGLTTAAGLWGTAGVGMAIGGGLYSIGISTTVLIVLIQVYFHRNNFLSKNEMYRYTLLITLKCIEEFPTIKNMIVQNNAHIYSINILKRGTKDTEVELELMMKESYTRALILEKLMNNECVVSAVWE